MKKVFTILLCVILSINAFCACLKNSGEFGKGKTMILDFETNPTTGYDWEYSFMTGDDKAEIVLDKDDIKLNDDMNLVGAPSRHIYYFKAKKPGKQCLTFTYKRPWKGGGTAYDVVYELKVDKKLNITCISKMKGVVESDKELSFFPNPTFE